MIQALPEFAGQLNGFERPTIVAKNSIVDFKPELFAQQAPELSGRVAFDQHQLLRVDFETRPSHLVLAAKLAVFKSALSSCDAVILSDYGKGGLEHIASMIGRARAAGKRVLVGPKGEDYSRYRGAHLITLNYAELRQAVGTWKSEADLARRAQKLRRCRVGRSVRLLQKRAGSM